MSLFTFNTINGQEIKPKENNQQKNISQNTILVKGVVADETGPLPGASILLQGTSIGTETDFDGNFEFPKKLKKGDVLIFSFVGLESKKVMIENKDSANKISLKIDMKSDSCMLLGKVAVKQIYSSKK